MNESVFDRGLSHWNTAAGMLQNYCVYQHVVYITAN